MSPLVTGPDRLDVGDVEEAGVGPAGEAGRQRLPDGRVRAVAAREIGRLAGLLRAVGPPERRPHAVALCDRNGPARCGAPLSPQRLQPFDQHSLVGVLREDEREGERGQAFSHAIQGQPCDLGALDPKLAAGNLDAAIDELVGHPELAVKLQGASLTARAREVVPGSAVLSMIRTATPSLVSQRASTRPVGPAPTIKTGTSVLDLSADPSRQSWRDVSAGACEDRAGASAVVRQIAAARRRRALHLLGKCSRYASSQFVRRQLL